MSAPTFSSPVSPPRRLRSGLLRLGLTVSIVLGLSATCYAYWRHTLNQELKAVVAEIDAQDPGWRLDDVEAARAPVPDEQNGAGCVLDASRALPETQSLPDRRWGMSLKKTLDDLDPAEQLGDEQVAAFRSELKNVYPALVEARKLADRPHGRYAVNWNTHLLDTPSPHLAQVRQVNSLLVYDAALRAQEGDMAGALASCRGALNAGRSLGDEPLALAQVIRSTCRERACAAIERTLAQGEVAEANLASLQELLQEEDREPLLWIALRGERATAHFLAEKIEEGSIHIDDLAHLRKRPAEAQVTGWWLEAKFESDHAAFLRRLTDALNLAQLPPHERAGRLRDWEKTVHNLPHSLAFTRMMLPAADGLDRAFQRSQAYLRCALVLLAAERYRLAHGTRPATLADLVPAYLPAVPLDPYDGQPLRSRWCEEGLVVYSIGPDGTDDHGKLDARNPNQGGIDVGYHLWELAQRRQPARPPKPAEPPTAISPRLQGQ